MVLSAWLNHFSLWGADVFTLGSILTITLFIFKRYQRNDIKKFPFKYGFALYIISIIVSGLLIGDPKPISIITNILRDVVNVFIFWSIINERPAKSVKTFYYTAIIFGITVALYTVYELITSSNPYLKFMNNIGAYKEDTLITSIRYGVKQCQSIFLMHTTLGGVTVMTFIPLIFISLKKQFKFIKKEIAFLFIPLLLFICFVTGARSVILGCIIGLLMFLDLRKFTIQNLGLFSISIVIIFFVVNTETFNLVVQSFLNSDSISGSNVDMRKSQFDIGYKYLNKSFLFGNGLFAWTEITKHTDLNGAESMWLPLMIDRGVFGVLSVLVLILNMIMYTIKRGELKILFFIFGYIVLNSMSSVPYVNFNYLFIYIFIMIYHRNPKYLSSIIKHYKPSK